MTKNIFPVRLTAFLLHVGFERKSTSVLSPCSGQICPEVTVLHAFMLMLF